MTSWPSCPKDDLLGRRGPRSPSARSSYDWDSPKLGSKVQRREFYRGQGQQRNSGGGLHQGETSRVSSRAGLVLKWKGPVCAQLRGVSQHRGL